MRRVLMIAYLFPPVGGIGSAGAQRVLKFAKYLPHFDWAPIILTAKEHCYEPYFATDASLLEKVPKDIRIIRTTVIRWLTRVLTLKQRVARILSPVTQPEDPAKPSAQTDRAVSSRKSWYQKAKDTFTDLFEIPDEEMGWMLPAVVSGFIATKRYGIDIIFSTGRPWSSHVIGMVLKFITGKPLVVDFRDPWMTNPFRSDYSAFRNAMEAFLERKVIEHADVVISNTNELQAEFFRRFSSQPKSKFVSLLNGFDPDDYETEQQQDVTPRRCLTITHTGFLYGRRDPKQFLEGLAVTAKRATVDRTKIRVVFAGSIQLPYDLPTHLASMKIDDLVVLQGQVSYQESLAHLRSADLLLLLQPGTSTQVPSKLFEYIAVKKPILAITPTEGATGRIVQDECSGTVVESDNVRQIADEIERAYQNWAAGALVATSEKAHRKYNITNMTGELAKMLTDLSRSHRLSGSTRSSIHRTTV